MPLVVRAVSGLIARAGGGLAAAKGAVLSLLPTQWDDQTAPFWGDGAPGSPESLWIDD